VETLETALLAQGVAGEDLVNAQARQRRLGGSFDTNVLELGLCTEAEMNELLSTVQRLPQPPEALLKAVNKSSGALLARPLAERYGLAPLGLVEKRLALLVRLPVDLAAIDEISFLVSRRVRVFVGTELQQQEAFALAYGVAPPPRFSRLRTRLERRRIWELENAAMAAVPLPESRLVGKPGPSTPTPTTSSTPTAITTAGPTPTETPPPPDDSDIEVLPLTTGFAAGVEASARTVTVVETLDQLRVLPSRDALIGAALRFLLVAFDFVVFYGRRGDEMTVFEASGVDFGGADISHTGVSLQRSSSLRTVVDTRASYVGPIPPGDPLESSLGYLGRSRLRAVFLYPVVVRDRTVGVVYGDRGGEALAPSQLSDVTLVLSQLGGAFERVLVEKGRNGERGRDRRNGVASPLPADPPDYPKLVRRFLSGDATARAEAAGRLALGGRAAAEALAERFPGPLYVLRNPPGRLPDPENMGPLVALMVRLGSTALPALQRMAEEDVGERRYWAGTLLLKLRGSGLASPAGERI
jgi:hypothetical protein